MTNLFNFPAIKKQRGIRTMPYALPDMDLSFMNPTYKRLARDSKRQAGFRSIKNFAGIHNWIADRNPVSFDFACGIVDGL
jgi:hypothetical protein